MAENNTAAVAAPAEAVPAVETKPVEVAKTATEAPGKEVSAKAGQVEEIDPSKTPVAKRKIKWGEQEKEISFDEAVQLAQKAFGIEEKARVASEKAKSAEAILDMLANNPKEFAKRCRAQGLDPNKLATEILYEQIELNSLSPEQRELKELKEKQAEEEAAKKDLEQKAKEADISKKTQEWGQKFEKDLMTALSAKQLPMSRLTLALAAQYIDGGLAQKKEYTVEQVLPFVLRDLKNINATTFGQLEGEDLLNYIGDDVSNKVAAARVARYKKGQAAPQVQTAPVKSTPKEDLSKLKGKAYWAALRRQKSEAGIDAFPGNE